MKKRIILTTLAIIVALGIGSSGWVFNLLKDRETAADREFSVLKQSFDQQYGTEGITITQLVAPKKVYAASWTSPDKASHVSWNIGGVWVTVWNGKIPEATTP